MAHGLEVEIPILRQKDNLPVSLAQVRRFWAYMHKKGWEYKRDPSTKHIVGLKKNIKGKVWTLDHEYGVATLEVGTPPMKSVASLKKAWDNFFKNELLPALDANGFFLLGMSHFPTAKDMSKDRTQKGHYHIWRGMFAPSIVKKLDKYAGGFCAMQYNVGAPVDMLVPLTNALTKLTSIFWGWSANSPFFDHTLQKTLSFRQKTYDDLLLGKWVKDRLNVIDRPFASLSDYVSRAWGQPIFEIIRDGQPWYQPKHTMSTWDLIEKGKGRFRNLKGEWKMWEIVPGDLNLGLYFYWPAVRIKCVLDESYAVDQLVAAVKGGHVEDVLKDPYKTAFLEIRQMDLPPQEEIFSWVALCEGLLHNVRGLQKFTKKWSMKDVFAASSQVQKKGLKARFQGERLSELAEEVLLISEKGLKRHAPSLMPWLEPLAKRVYMGACPARESIEIYKKEGLESAIEARRFI